MKTMETTGRKIERELAKHLLDEEKEHFAHVVEPRMEECGREARLGGKCTFHDVCVKNPPFVPCGECPHEDIKVQDAYDNDRERSA